MAELVAPWISAAPELKEDKKLASGSVQVTLGTDFLRVSEPDESAIPPAVAPAAPAAAATPTTTEPGWKPGVPPEGTSCP